MDKEKLEIKKIYDTEQYIQGVLRHESVDFDAIRERFSDPRKIRLLHAALGLATEAGEILDTVKKHLFYGKPLDFTNLEEEGGDVMWYLGILADVLEHKDFATMMGRNNAKLTLRFGEKEFSAEKALNRNLDGEREILEMEVK